MAFAKSLLSLGFALVASACSNATAARTTDAPTTTAPIVAVANQGSAMEGHTPTGFAGMGTGLFVGDNLNSSFPEGQGVQTFLTFTLPDDLAVLNARINSDAPTTVGSPFEDLGPLVAEPVEYESFGSEIFDLPPVGEAVVCRRDGDSSIECDVTEAVRNAVAEGRDTAQFRLRFERPADNDGQADLAMFYRTDSNTNEVGLFVLRLTRIP